MTSPSPGHRRKSISRYAAPSSSRRKPQNMLPEKHSGSMVRPFVSTPPLTPKLPFPAMRKGDDSIRRLSKLLVNVTVENSPGAMQVVMLAEDTVGDLVKASLVFYEKEKRRPFLKDTDPMRYDLHYSSFALQSLQQDKKLVNLGSRNFFLCSKRPASSCSNKENMPTIDSARPWVTFVHLLL